MAMLSVPDLILRVLAIFVLLQIMLVSWLLISMSVYFLGTGGLGFTLGFSVMQRLPN
jgi:hypothetical protein